MAYHPDEPISKPSDVRTAAKTALTLFGTDYRKDPFGLLLWITLTFTVILGLFGRHVSWEVYVITAGLVAAKVYNWFLTEGYQKPFFVYLRRRASRRNRK